MPDFPVDRFEDTCRTRRSGDPLMDRVWASATRLQAMTDETYRRIAESQAVLARLHRSARAERGPYLETTEPTSARNGAAHDVSAGPAQHTAARARPDARGDASSMMRPQQPGDPTIDDIER
jgi:hypothetical protein